MTELVRKAEANTERLAAQLAPGGGSAAAAALSACSPACSPAVDNIMHAVRSSAQGLVGAASTSGAHLAPTLIKSQPCALAC